jgi:hypothetical protein
VIDALSDGVAGSRHGHRPLRRVGQHLGGHDDGCTGNFANFLNFGASLADQRATLRRRHDKAQRDRWPRNASACQRTSDFLKIIRKKEKKIRILS